MNARKELELMVKLMNEIIFEHPQKLELKIERRRDLGGILAFIVLIYNCEMAVRNTVMMPIPPVTICWGGGVDADAACEIALKKFENGSDLIREYLPFTAGSFAELKMKAAAYYG